MENYYVGSILAGYKQEMVNTRATADSITGYNDNFSMQYYDEAGTTTEHTQSGVLKIDLLPNHSESAVPSSVNFKLGDKTYFDKGGQIATDLNSITGESTIAGTIDYANATATIRAGGWSSAGSIIPILNSLTTTLDGNPVDKVTFRTPQSPIRAGSLSIRATALDGTFITGKANYAGIIKAAGIEGIVDTEYGVVDIRFGKMMDTKDANGNIIGQKWQSIMVFAETITYNADVYSYLPIDSGVVKIDTVRLPQDGRVPIFRRGDTILISNRQVDNIGSAFTGGQTMTLSRKDVDRICVNDADGKPVLATLWDYDLDNGTITWASPLDLSAYKLPLSVTHVQEERNRILQADIDGTLTLIFPTKRAYPLIDTYVSSVLIGGDLQVRVSVPFTQKAWKNIWQDMPDGDQLLNKLNLKDYPMLLTDDGAITDRWMIKWLSGSQFEMYSEALGFVGKYDTLTDLAPINPATGKPYFIIPKQAFGNLAPWGTQDIIRFNTWGTLMPVWVLCAAQPTATVPEGEDGFIQCLYGDTTEA